MNPLGFASSTVSKLHKLICELAYYTLFKFRSKRKISEDVLSWVISSYTYQFLQRFLSPF
jgi:hypothetical protein